MVDDRVLVRVDAKDLPPRVRDLLDPAIPRPTNARFLVRRTHLSWTPAVWLAALAVLGIASLALTVTAGLDASAGDQRFIYGAIAAVSLALAAVAARKLIAGRTERRDVQRGDYRLGLHVLGSQGLLIAGRDHHTWVPRRSLPAPTAATNRGGGASAPAYIYIITDENGRTERLDCGILTTNVLQSWVEHGQLPRGGCWQ